VVAKDCERMDYASALSFIYDQIKPSHSLLAGPEVVNEFMG
jgi:hypothetical protein